MRSDVPNSTIRPTSWLTMNDVGKSREILTEEEMGNREELGMWGESRLVGGSRTRNQGIEQMFL